MRVAVEEFLEYPPTIAREPSGEKLAGLGGKRRRGRPGWFNFEADNVSVQQVRQELYEKKAPADRMSLFAYYPVHFARVAVLQVGLS